MYINFFNLVILFNFSVYEESAESLHQLSDKLPAPGNFTERLVFILKVPVLRSLQAKDRQTEVKGRGATNGEFLNVS